jgi:hypothetical protein
MSSVEELADLAQFVVQIVASDLQADAHLLHIKRFGLGPVLLGLLGLLIIVFAPVDNAGDRRVGVGRDLDEIEPGLFGGGERLGTGNNTKLAAVFPDNAKTIGPDFLVDAGIFGYFGNSISVEIL